MLIRLLVVVLTLVGPMPFRACTCAASVPVRTPSGESAPRPTPTPKRCGCEHGAASGEKGEAGGTTSVSAHTEGGSDDSGPAGCTPHRDRHERDCPATDPSPVVRDAVTPSSVDAPIACADPAPVVLCRTLHPSNTPVAPRLAQPRTPKLPLYITLLSIQN